MSNIREIRQKDLRENIPEMLRTLADQIENGSESYTTLWVVALDDLDQIPRLYMYGREVPRLIEVGALTAVLHSMTAMDCIE